MNEKTRYAVKYNQRNIYKQKTLDKGDVMWINTEKPRLVWIGSKRPISDGEWITYAKKISTEKNVKSAVVRFESDSNCALYVNGEFVISSTGRNPERVNCHEITSLFTDGENDIKVTLSSGYFQGRAKNISEFRDYWFSMFAMEFDIEFCDGTKLVVTTDGSWEAEVNGGGVLVMETMPVTDPEYDNFWKFATPWLEKKLHKAEIPEAVISVAGEEYKAYAEKEIPKYAYPKLVAKTNMILSDGKYIPDEKCDAAPYIIYDFERATVGFTELLYKAEEDNTATLGFDFRENIADFDHDPECEWTYIIEALVISQKLSKDETSAFNLRRRACRFVKVEFEKGKKIEVENLRFLQCLYPNMKEGWFDCSDERLGAFWEMGKYTLHVNKQQEYESCPRNEMTFFSGDGLLDMVVDLYAFGEVKLMESSLSLNYSEAAGGITHTEDFNRSRHQWDYNAWRIICIEYYYKATGNKEFLKKYFPQAETILKWHINRMGYNNLIFQPMCLLTAYTMTYAQVDWACGIGRLGDKPYLNALYYKSLTAMAYLAKEMGEDEKAKEWEALAVKVKDAINEQLWSEEKQSYVDKMADYISHDGNLIPLYFGVADENRTKAALDTIKKELWTPAGSTILNTSIKDVRGGNKAVSPFMSTFEAELRFMNGDEEGGLEVIRRVWGAMLDRGAHTCWEYVPVKEGEWWDALCHAWATGCTYLLSAYVLGIRQTSPNFTGIVFEPKLCGLEYVKGVVPCENGFIAAKCENGKYTIAVPEGTEVETRVPEGSEVEIIRY